MFNAAGFDPRNQPTSGFLALRDAWVKADYPPFHAYVFTCKVPTPPPFVTPLVEFV